MSGQAVPAGVLVAAAVVLGTAPWWSLARLRSSGRAARSGDVRTVRRGQRTVEAPEPTVPPATDAAFLLDLCGAAVAAGAALPRTLVVVGRHLGGPDGDALVRAGATLELGGAWDLAWAGAPPGAAVVGDALATAWQAGASPGPQLRAASDRLRRERRARVRAAAGALSVRLTLPLGACFLPAFVLLGLVPVVLGLAHGLGW